MREQERGVDDCGMDDADGVEVVFETVPDEGGAGREVCEEEGACIGWGGDDT